MREILTSTVQNFYIVVLLSYCVIGSETDDGSGNDVRRDILTYKNKVKMGWVLPVKMGRVVPVKMGRVVPVKMRRVVPVKMGRVVPVKMGRVLPVKMGRVVPVKMGMVVPVKMLGKRKNCVFTYENFKKSDSHKNK